MKKIPTCLAKPPMKWALIWVLGCLLSACASNRYLGNTPALEAPRLELSSAKDEKNLPIYRWNRPSSFAQINPDQKAAGDAACLAARSDLVALGYHPQAQDLNGLVIPGGGYLCAKKDRGDQPDPVAPQLVTTRGVLGWDRPSLFGRVPPEAQPRGARVCKALDVNFVAVGFHPDAKDEGGRSIEGGGFFCAIKPNFLRAQ